MHAPLALTPHFFTSSCGQHPVDPSFIPLTAPVMAVWNPYFSEALDDRLCYKRASRFPWEPQGQGSFPLDTEDRLIVPQSPHASVQINLPACPSWKQHNVFDLHLIFSSEQAVPITTAPTGLWFLRIPPRTWDYRVQETQTYGHFTTFSDCSSQLLLFFSAG